MPSVVGKWLEKLTIFFANTQISGAEDDIPASIQ